VYLTAIEREIAVRARELPGGTRAVSLYLGGGTPSSLLPADLARLVSCLDEAFSIAADAERTIEVNPEDVSRESLAAWRSLGFNRLSIGVQSFSTERLRSIRRRHSADEAIAAARLSADAGFDNISMDLITGLPGQSWEETRRDLETLAGLPVVHASLYLLSVDAGSLFAVEASRGRLTLPGDDDLAERFTRASDFLQANGFAHYEISNFARDGRLARHNLAYWQLKPYVGLGPAAHSFDGHARRWNVAHVKRYAEALLAGKAYFEGETLSPADRYNEYVMTGLRLATGLSLARLRSEHAAHFSLVAPTWERYFSSGLLTRSGDRILPTRRAWLISDTIFSDLFSFT
jgi:oxygen-independent coproporphyrinogen-3 oxidase